MDPLSDVLSLVRPQAYGSGGLSGGGRWALRFPAHAGIKCYAVTQGECWLVLDGVAKPIHLATGDCLMLPHGRPFRMCSDLRARAVDARTLSVGARYNVNHVGAPEADFFVLGAHFSLQGNAQVLLRVLPPFVHFRKDAEQASLREPVERMVRELREPQPGGFLITQQSAYTMLVLALRLYLARGERAAVGWLRALADEQIALAMTSMHEQPSHGWTVESLAEEAHMSRTTFAQRFRETVGDTPLEYLTRWRMLVASDRLRHSTDAISEIAQTVGYASESAFSAAFKRTMGTSPRAYARAPEAPR